MIAPDSKNTPTLPCGRHRNLGVTLIELLTVMTIVAVLMAIGVPSYKYVTSSNRATSEINAILGDLQFARSEAIKEGQPVSVCVTTDPTDASPTCATGASLGWQTGWLVFSDVNGDGKIESPDDTVLKVQKQFSSQDTLQNDNATNEAILTFSREGFTQNLSGYVTFTLHDSPPNLQFTRCLLLSIVGSLHTYTGGEVMNKGTVSATCK